MEWRRAAGLEWLEATLPRARVAFSTRRGGVSDGPFAGLNLGLLSGDERSAVLENRRRLADALGLEPAGVAIGRQVHGVALASHSARQAGAPFLSPGPELPEADGQVTSEPGIAVLVLVADCLPVALSGPRGVAMLHCGWRGLAGGIVSRGVAAVDATAAAIGPGIGPCCYEVGEEVLGAFAQLGPGIAADGRLDLPEVARRVLAEAGVERVESAGICTGCERERFFSHRRDAGRSGRQAGLAWLREEA